MASITSLGTGSNLDLESLLTKLVSAEKDPRQKQIDNRKALTNATISALGSIKSKLSAFQTAQAKLKETSFFAGKTATSSDTTLFSVTASNTAAAGNYNISVIDLAKANKVASGSFASADTVVGSGTLTIGVGSNTFDVAITAGQNDTLAGIRDAINNATGNTGVTASILTVSNGSGGTESRLVLTANTTGASSQISVAVADSDTTNTDNAGLSQLYYLKGDVGSQLSEVAAAQDARITVDGFTATSSTNQFTDVISGVTINALRGATDPLNPPAGTLAVNVDQGAIKTAIEGFVNAYNDLSKAFASLTTYNKDTSSGGLSGDSSLLAIRGRVKEVLATSVADAPGDFNSLAFLGVSTNKDGTITLDSTKLTNALNNRLDDVTTLFAGNEGVAVKYDTLLSNLVSSGGIFQTRETALNDQLRRLDDQQSALDLRIESFTKRYRAQFTALDSLVNQLNSTGNFLTQQLDAAAKIITRKNS